MKALALFGHMLHSLFPFTASTTTGTIPAEENNDTKIKSQEQVVAGVSATVLVPTALFLMVVTAAVLYYCWNRKRRRRNLSSTEVNGKAPAATATGVSEPLQQRLEDLVSGSEEDSLRQRSKTSNKNQTVDDSK